MYSTTYTTQIEKLKNKKNVTITNTPFCINIPKNISYYGLIDGYAKHPFIDIHTRKYVNNTCFENIVALYELDEDLRELFFKYLCCIERKLRSSISFTTSVKNMENVKKNTLIPTTTT